MATNISHWLKGGSKITYLRKSVFLSTFEFSNIASIILSHFIIVPYFSLWMLDFFDTIWVLNNLDPDQARQFVGPELGSNCLQRLSADNKSRSLGAKSFNIKQLYLSILTFWLFNLG